MAKIKLSAYIPAELHRLAKFESFEKGTTIQHVVEDALQRFLDPARSVVPVLKPKERQLLIAQLNEVLDSGNELYIANCLACIRGTFGLMKAEKRLSTIQTIQGSPATSAPSEPDIEKKKERSKRLLPNHGGAN
jgi:hypothetical protein